MRAAQPLAVASRPLDGPDAEAERGRARLPHPGGRPLTTALLAEMLGRRDGSLGGKGGSMHLSAPEIGLLPTFAIVGGGIPVAVGAAYASQVKGDGGVAVAAFGDGATNIGAFHEGLNMASVWRLPAVFVCENNLYGGDSRVERERASTVVAAR